MTVVTLVLIVMFFGWLVYNDRRPVGVPVEEGGDDFGDLVSEALRDG